MTDKKDSSVGMNSLGAERIGRVRINKKPGKR